MTLTTRISTDVAGIERCLGSKSEAAVAEDVLLDRISAKLTSLTLFLPSGTGIVR